MTSKLSSMTSCEDRPALWETRWLLSLITHLGLVNRYPLGRLAFPRAFWSLDSNEFCFWFLFAQIKGPSFPHSAGTRSVQGFVKIIFVGTVENYKDQFTNNLTKKNGSTLRIVSSNDVISLLLSVQWTDCVDKKLLPSLNAWQPNLHWNGIAPIWRCAWLCECSPEHHHRSCNSPIFEREPSPHRQGKH
jgi:hypothetical protein